MPALPWGSIPATTMFAILAGSALTSTLTLAGCAGAPHAPHEHSGGDTAAHTVAAEACLSRPLNEVQVIGSHNSYRRLPPDSVLAMLDEMRPGLRTKLEYQHPPLDRQLDLGLRLLELDFYADPEGGLFADPPNIDVLSDDEARPFTPDQIAKPGFKVMHIQGYDNYSHCVDLRDCLTALKAWSDANASHTLITVTMNVKEDRVFDGLPSPARFDAAMLDDVDALLVKVFGRDRLFTPDDVRGEAPTLREAVLTTGWPTLSQLRQKFMFVLDEGRPSASLAYREGHPSLRGRAMFAQYPPDDEAAAFFGIWRVEGHEEAIADLVDQGFLVRVAADIGTVEARNNDRSRLKAAIGSGAQFIASDYYPGHNSPFATAYVASFEDGSIVTCSAEDG